MTSTPQKVVLFANGDLPAPKLLLAMIASDDFLIAVDGGLGHMTHLGLTPNLIIGDLDSANEEDVRQFQFQGVEVRKHPIDKDETDLEIALDVARELDPAVIWMVAALGKRLDQTLGNIFLLTRSDLASYDIRLVDGQTELFLIRKSGSIIGKAGQLVSLLPLNGPVTGIQTDGLEYPLSNETLYTDRTRGISNRMVASSALITIQTGLLLCIHEITDPAQRNTEND